MGGLLAEVIPLALGAAISPMVFLGAIAVMTGPGPLAHGCAYAIGVAIPLLVVTVVAMILGHGFSLPDASDAVKGWIDVGFGVALVLLGVRAVRRPPVPAEPRAQPQGQGLGRFVAMGAGLMTSNVTTFALYIPAMKLIQESGVSTTDEVAAIAIVLAITMALSSSPGHRRNRPEGVGASTHPCRRLARFAPAHDRDRTLLRLRCLPADQRPGGAVGTRGRTYTWPPLRAKCYWLHASLPSLKNGFEAHRPL